MAKKHFQANRVYLKYDETFEQNLTTITSTKEVVEYLRMEFETDSTLENSSLIFALNADYQIVCMSHLKLKNPNDSIDKIRKIFQILLLSNANMYVLIDHCPDGNLSMNDHQLEIKYQLEYLEGIMSFKLIDYILTNSIDYWSFNEGSWDN